jgi:MoxR-like ATPase
MTPNDLIKNLSQLVSGNLHTAAMVWGPPGVGKSSIVSQVAKANDIKLVDLRLSQLAPTDLRGLPVAKDGRSTWYPPEFLPTSGRGILFLDELNMAPPAIQGIAQQLVLDRRVGNYEVPDGWLVWAAGNRKEDRASVFEMPAPLANRFLHFEVQIDFESFRSWAIQSGIHEQILAFLAFRPDLLHKPDPSRPAWPSPRSWEMASQMLHAQLPLAPAIGAAVVGEFNAFTKIYTAVPNLDEILQGNGQKTEFDKDPSIRYAVTFGLSSRARQAKEITNAIQWLLDKAAPEWIQLFIHNIQDRAVATNQLGILATVIKTDPRIKDFIKGYKEALVAA